MDPRTICALFLVVLLSFVSCEDSSSKAVNADEDPQEVNRSTRSIGNIARLLLGGNVPPDHPLVKYPDPIYSQSSTPNKVIAAVPGMNGVRTDATIQQHQQPVSAASVGAPVPAVAYPQVGGNLQSGAYQPLQHNYLAPPPQHQQQHQQHIQQHVQQQHQQHQQQPPPPPPPYNPAPQPNPGFQQTPSQWGPPPPNNYQQQPNQQYPAAPAYQAPATGPKIEATTSGFNSPSHSFNPAPNAYSPPQNSYQNPGNTYPAPQNPTGFIEPGGHYSPSGSPPIGGNTYSTNGNTYDSSRNQYPPQPPQGPGYQTSNQQQPNYVHGQTHQAPPNSYQTPSSQGYSPTGNSHSGQVNSYPGQTNSYHSPGHSNINTAPSYNTPITSNHITDNIYNNPPPSYPSNGYNAPSPSYTPAIGNPPPLPPISNSPSSYNQPSSGPSYNSPSSWPSYNSNAPPSSSAYNGASSGYNPPPSNHNSPPLHHNSPPSNYNPSPPNYNSPPSNYPSNSPSYNSPPSSYNSPPSSYNPSPSSSYNSPSKNYEGPRHKTYLPQHSKTSPSYKTYTPQHSKNPSPSSRPKDYSKETGYRSRYPSSKEYRSKSYASPTPSYSSHSPSYKNPSVIVAHPKRRPSSEQMSRETYGHSSKSKHTGYTGSSTYSPTKGDYRSTSASYEKERYKSSSKPYVPAKYTSAESYRSTKSSREYRGPSPKPEYSSRYRSSSSSSSSTRAPKHDYNTSPKKTYRTSKEQEYRRESHGHSHSHTQIPKPAGTQALKVTYKVPTTSYDSHSKSEPSSYKYKAAKDTYGPGNDGSYRPPTPVYSSAIKNPPPPLSSYRTEAQRMTDAYNRQTQSARYSDAPGKSYLVDGAKRTGKALPVTLAKPKPNAVKSSPAIGSSAYRPSRAADNEYLEGFTPLKFARSSPVDKYADSPIDTQGLPKVNPNIVPSVAVFHTSYI